jgi:hypothetical protein
MIVPGSKVGKIEVRMWKMGETEGIEKLLEKLHQLMKVKKVDNLTLTANGSSEVLQISAKELKKLRQINECGKSQTKRENKSSRQFCQSCSELPRTMPLVQMKLLAQIR